MNTFQLPCIVGIPCDPILNGTNGGIASSGGTSYPSNVTYECDEGYNLVGNATISCSTSGTWSSEPPTCISKDKKPFHLFW